LAKDEKRREIRSALREERSAAPPTVVDFHARLEKQQIVQRTLARLTPRMRRVLLLFCEDELTLQKFLDEELAPDASELVFHHLKGRQRCASVFQDLKDEQSFCQRQLGSEDEIEDDHLQAVLRRVRIQLEAKAESGDGRPSAEGEAQPSRSD